MSLLTKVAVLTAPAPEFHSSQMELDEWLSKHGLEATRARSATVYLAYSDDRVVGYFALSAGSVDPSAAGSRTRRGMPRYPIPAVLLARMAVIEEAHGQGVGRELVQQAAAITLEVARLVAVRVLVVDAIDEAVARFYEHVGFTRNEANPLRLEVLVKDLEAAQP